MPTKLDALRDSLSALAHELGPEAKLPTVLQLRDQFGVSVATLDNALGELEAQNVLTRRHGVGIFVSPKLHQRALCLVQDPGFLRLSGGSPFWELLIDQARHRAAVGDEAFSLHFAAPPGDDRAPLHDALMADIQSGRVQGVLSVGLRPSATKWLQAQNVPHVAFAAYAPHTVALDGAALVRLGVAALAAQGCRRLALWASGGDHHDFFRRELTAHGLPHLPELAPAPDAAPGPPQEQGYRTARRVFGDPSAEKPDGILITDDMMALGALVGLQKQGVRVGADVQIASHANRGSPVLLGQDDVLTRIEIDPARVAHAMFATLETLMDGGTPAEPIVWIAPTLRPRRTDHETAAVNET